MTELVCAHKWRSVEGEVTTNVEERMVRVPVMWKECRRCCEVWTTDRPEPRVVIGRLE